MKIITLALAALITMTLLVAFTGCSIPVAIEVQDDNATYGYSSKGGLTIKVEK